MKIREIMKYFKDEFKVLCRVIDDKLMHYLIMFTIGAIIGTITVFSSIGIYLFVIGYIILSIKPIKRAYLYSKELKDARNN